MSTVTGPTFITFYSFKGGVGRTQTLANVAVALANRGKKVIVVDFDLESPGLHRYFSPKEDLSRRIMPSDLSTKGGLLDWLYLCNTVPEEEPFVTDCLLPCSCPELITEKGSIELIACGNLEAVNGKSYASRVADFDWTDFYTNAYGQDFMDQFRIQLAATGADYVLIDSRTGLTDVGLLCTFFLPDVVVLMFALHRQGIEGVQQLAQGLKLRTQELKTFNREHPTEPVSVRPSQVLLLPSRVDEDRELDLRDTWIERARTHLRDDGIWLGKLGERLPYLARAAFGENILVDSRREPTELSQALFRLTSILESICETGNLPLEEAAIPERSLETIALDCERFESHLTAFKAAFYQQTEPSDTASLPSLFGMMDKLRQHYNNTIQLLKEAEQGIVAFAEQARIEPMALLPGQQKPLDTLAGLFALQTQLAEAHQAIRDQIASKREDIRVQLETAAPDEPAHVADVLQSFESLLDRGQIHRIEEQLPALLEQLRQNSFDQLLKRGSLSQARFQARFATVVEQCEWLETRLQVQLEDSSAELEVQRAVLRNLLKLHPKQAPSRLLWDAWDTLCMLHSDPGHHNQALPLFQETGEQLWKVEWQAVLDHLLKSDELEPNRLVTAAGHEAEQLLKQVLEEHGGALEGLCVLLTDKLLLLLNHANGLSRLREFMRSRRQDMLLKLVIEGMCRLDSEFTQINALPAWQLPLIASTLELLSKPDAALYESWITALCVPPSPTAARSNLPAASAMPATPATPTSASVRDAQRPLVREAFYSFVALSHEGIELSSSKSVIRDLPVRFIQSLMQGDESARAEALALLQSDGFCSLLSTSPAGQAVLMTLAYFPHFMNDSFGRDFQNEQMLSLRGWIKYHADRDLFERAVLELSEAGEEPVHGLFELGKKLEEKFGELERLMARPLRNTWDPIVHYQESLKETFDPLTKRIQQSTSGWDTLWKEVHDMDYNSWAEYTQKEWMRRKNRSFSLPHTPTKETLEKLFQQCRRLLLDACEIGKGLPTDIAPRELLKTLVTNRLAEGRLRAWIQRAVTRDLGAWLLGDITTVSGEQTIDSSLKHDAPPAQTQWLIPPELIFRPNLLSLPPLLLQVEEGNLPEHWRAFQAALLEYHSGHRTWRSVAQQYLKDARFDLAASSLLAMDSIDAELLSELSESWRTRLNEATQTLNAALQEREQLKSRGLNESDAGELNDWLAQLNQALEALPDPTSETLLTRLRELGQTPFSDLQLYASFVQESLQTCRNLLQQRQEQERKQLLELKRKIDSLANELEMADTPLTEAQAEGLTRLQQRASEGLRRREPSILREVLEHIQAAQHAPQRLETVPEKLVRPASSMILSATTTTTAPPTPDPRVPSTPLEVSRIASRSAPPSLFSGAGASVTRDVAQIWSELSDVVVLELNLLDSTTAPAQAPGNIPAPPEWEETRLSPLRIFDPTLLESARAQLRKSPRTVDSLLPLTVFLACRGFQAFHQGRPGVRVHTEFLIEALGLLIQPHVRLPQKERWTQLLSKSLLLSLRIRYSSDAVEREKWEELVDQDYPLILNDLERRELLRELSDPLLLLGVRGAEQTLLKDLAVWLKRRPLSLMELLETLCEDAELFSRGLLAGKDNSGTRLLVRAVSACVRIALTLLSSMELLAEEVARPLLKRMVDLDQSLQAGAPPDRLRAQLTSGLEVVIAELDDESLSEPVTTFKKALRKLLDDQQKGSLESPYLSDRLLTPTLQLEGVSQPALILELHYLRGFGTLRNVSVEAELLDESRKSLAPTLKPVPTIPRLRFGAVEELRLPLLTSSPLLDQARFLKVNLRARGWNLNTTAPEVRYPELSVQLHREPRSTEPLNPFIMGRPIQNAEQIFGRDEQVEQIRRALMGAFQDQVVMIMGERRSGKTTLLNKLKRHPFIFQRYQTFDIDLQSIAHQETSTQFFQERFAIPIQRELERVGLGKVSVDTERFRNNAPAAFREFMLEVDVLLQRRDRRLLLMLDELERLFELIERREQNNEAEQGEGFGREVIAGLRDVIQKAERISFILCGVAPVLKRFTTRPSDRFFKMAVEVECKTLSVDAATQLICEPARKVYEVLQPGFQRINRETARQPNLIQTVCHAVFNYAVKHRLATIARSHVDQVLEEIIGERRTFTFLNDDVKDDQDFLIVRALANVQRGNGAVPFPELVRQLRAMGSRLDAEKLFTRLKHLEVNAPQVVERRVASTDSFRLTVGLYARHLRYIQREDR